MQKYIPLGSENFPSLMKDSYYVDKTRFIEEVLHATDQTTFLFTRPRRFGKSLMLSMLDSFFNCQKDSRALFSSLEVAKSEDAMEQINMFHVIHLNLKNIGKSSYKGFLDALYEHIVEVYKMTLRGFDYKQSDECSYIDELLQGMVSEIKLSLSLYKLSKALHEIDDRPVLILIDEYDAPIQEGYLRGYYDLIKDFFRDFFGNALKGNPYCEKAIVTGVMQIAQASIFSGLNNLIVDNGLKNTGVEYFGFNDADVETLFDYYHVPFDREKLMRWYGNYVFSGVTIYSPWSILSLLQNKMDYQPYWINTGSTEIIEKTFVDEETLEIVKSLMEGRQFYFNIDPSFSYSDLHKRETAMNLLFFTGYLTCRRSEFGQWKVFVPNEEIKFALKNNVYNRFVRKDQFEVLDNLRAAFLDGDSYGVKDYIEKYLLSSLSYFDFSSERSYQVMMITLTALLFDQAVVESEAEVGEGRCDIYISSKGEGGHAFVIEVKNVGKKTNNVALESSAKTALSQIEKNKYYEKALRYNRSPIYLFGIAFAGKRCCIETKKL